MLKIGQKVVCVATSPSNSVIEGEIYTVSETFYIDGYNGVSVEEVKPPFPCLAFFAWRFRSIEDSWVDDILEEIIKQPELVS